MGKRNSVRAVLLLSAAACLAFLAGSANAELLVYEPFDYGDAWLNGSSGALGTTGAWVSTDTGCADGWRVHPEGQLTGVAVNAGYDPLNPDVPGILNMFDGTVANLPTTGGFAGMAGPEDRGLDYGTDGATGNLDAYIGLNPSVTATFQSGTTTWFSYVGAHAWDRNQGSPTVTIGTDPTTPGARGLTMQNAGSGLSAVGGPPRFNLFDVYPHYFRNGAHNQTPGGYDANASGLQELGWHNGIVTAFVSTSTGDGTLGNDDVMDWLVSDAEGFGAPNIIVGKIEWDADTGGYDVITVVGFLETDAITEAAFDALVAAKPTLSSRNWLPDFSTPADPTNPSNKPNLDQSQFDTLTISSLKFFVDEIRIGTTFDDIIGVSGPVVVPGDANGDGIVDAADYIIFKAHVGQASTAGAAEGDFDESGTVDWADLQTLVGALNAAGGAGGTIPEPATLGLLAVGALAVIRRRKLTCL